MDLCGVCGVINLTAGVVHSHHGWYGRRKDKNSDRRQKRWVRSYFLFVRRHCSFTNVFVLLTALSVHKPLPLRGVTRVCGCIMNCYWNKTESPHSFIYRMALWSQRINRIASPVRQESHLLECDRRMLQGLINNSWGFYVTWLMGAYESHPHRSVCPLLIKLYTLAQALTLHISCPLTRGC